MYSIFGGMNVALRALTAQQQVIAVIEHNVANASTKGYSRQEAVLKAGLPYAAPSMYRSAYAGQLGGGVRVSNIRRFNLEFMDTRYRNELAASQEYYMKSQVLNQTEAILSETGEDGLINRLDEFWSSWQVLSAEPDSATYRADLLEKSIELASGFNRRALQLTQQRSDLDLQVEQTVQEINEIASQIAEINKEVSLVKSVGDSPNDYLDERDRLLDRLAEIAGATSHTQENGETMVSIYGHSLVFGSTAVELQTFQDGSNSNLLGIVWEDGNSFTSAGGELKGLMDARDTDIPNHLDVLNELANTLIDEVNNVHNAGFDLNNAAGGNFFTPAVTLASAALGMTVDSSIINDLNLIAAAEVAGGAPGDGNNARLISELQDALLFNGGSATANDFYTGKIAELGLTINNANTTYINRTLVADSLYAQKQEVAGVNLDEEAANLATAQYAYQAASRLMNAYDQMADIIINSLGYVGR